ncbi:hypothetical protein HY358_01940 [Candidatus Roizmanbacteria bacterium]|nr:hypothetical protein [Candidatus Roizmanbacteria bacterium]
MIIKGSLITTLFIINLFIQLLTQIVITRIYGATLQLDAFLAAVVIPSIFVTVIYSTLNDAFLPLYSKKRGNNAEEAERYFFTHLVAVTTIAFILSLILNFVAEPISNSFYSEKGGEFVSQVANQMRYMIYSLPLAIVATFFGAYYYVRKQFLRFPLAQAVGSLSNLLLVLLLSQQWGIWALVFAFVINILFQIMVVIPGNILNMQLSPLNMIPLLVSWLPLVIGTLALRSDSLLIRSFATSLPEGYVVYLNLIVKMLSLATGVLTIGIQILLLPHLVEYIHSGKYLETIRMVNRSKMVGVGIAIVVTIIAILVAPIVIQIFFIGGKFTITDAGRVISLIPLFVLPAIGWGVNSIFFQPLIALRKNIPLSAVQIASVIFGWSIGFITKAQFGALAGITTGLTTMLFAGIIGSEILWQLYKKEIRK